MLNICAFGQAIRRVPGSGAGVLGQQCVQTGVCGNVYAGKRMQKCNLQGGECRNAVCKGVKAEMWFAERYPQELCMQDISLQEHVSQEKLSERKGDDSND